jgi:hypothetical protein
VTFQRLNAPIFTIFKDVFKGNEQALADERNTSQRQPNYLPVG